MSTAIDVPQGHLGDMGGPRNLLAALGRFAGTFLVKTDLQALEPGKRKHGHVAVTIEGPNLWVFDIDSTAGASSTVLVPNDSPTAGRWARVTLGGGGIPDGAILDDLNSGGGGATNPITDDLGSGGTITDP